MVFTLEGKVQQQYEAIDKEGKEHIETFYELIKQVPLRILQENVNSFQEELKKREKDTGQTGFYYTKREKNGNLKHYEEFQTVEDDKPSPEKAMEEYDLPFEYALVDIRANAKRAEIIKDLQEMLEKNPLPTIEDFVKIGTKFFSLASALAGHVITGPPNENKVRRWIDNGFKFAAMPDEEKKKMEEEGNEPYSIGNFFSSSNMNAGLDDKDDFNFWHTTENVRYKVEPEIIGELNKRLEKLKTQAVESDDMSFNDLKVAYKKITEELNKKFNSLIEQSK